MRESYKYHLACHTTSVRLLLPCLCRILSTSVQIVRSWDSNSQKTGTARHVEWLTPLPLACFFDSTKFCSMADTFLHGERRRCTRDETWITGTHIRTHTTKCHSRILAKAAHSNSWQRSRLTVRQRQYASGAGPPKGHRYLHRSEDSIKHTSHECHPDEIVLSRQLSQGAHANETKDMVHNTRACQLCTEVHAQD